MVRWRRLFVVVAGLCVANIVDGQDRWCDNRTPSHMCHGSSETTDCPCVTSLEVARQMLQIGYYAGPDYDVPTNPSFVGVITIGDVHGLPDSLLESAHVHVNGRVERVFADPLEIPSAEVALSLHSDLFSWGDAQVSRLAFREAVVPFLLGETARVDARLAELERQFGMVLEPHVVERDFTAFHALPAKPGQTVSEIVSAPQLQAIRRWLDASLPDGADKMLLPNGYGLRVPDPDGTINFSYSDTPGLFHDRGGVLDEGDRLLVAFQRRHFRGDRYHLDQNPRWTVFWGDEMDAIARELARLVDCAARRVGKRHVVTSLKDLSAANAAIVECRSEIRDSSR